MACDIETVLANACTSGIGKVTDKLTLLKLIAQLTCEQAAAGGAATWGNIEGTLSNQTDLNNALRYTFRDHFIGGTVANPGDNSLLSYGASPVIRARLQSGRFGVWHLLTSGAANAAAGVGSVYDSSLGNVSCIDTTLDGWKFTCVFRLNETTNIYARIGMIGFGPVALTTAELQGMYVRYRSSTDGAKFVFVCRNSITETPANSTVNVDTGWHTLTVRREAGVIYFSMDGEAEVSINATLPSLAMCFGASQAAEVAAAKSLYLDYMEFLYPA